MRSPKFTFSVKSIRGCVGQPSLANAWRKKVKAQLRKQIIRDLIEFRDIDLSLSTVTKQLAADLEAARYKVSPPQTYLVEKSRGLCRQMTLVGPRDLMVLQALSSVLHGQIVAKSPSPRAFFQPGDMKWSTGQMTIPADGYGGLASWKRFQSEVLSFSKENKYVVVTDVANFYDFINFSHLRNIIASLCEVDETILDLLLHVLNEMTWVPDYMPRQQVGMPQIETEAPRVLANAMLFELDKVAEDRAFRNYARFMDDIDCGVDSIVEAKRFVRDVDLTLQSRQLRLNSAKTKILSQKDAYKHFCISENRFLDRYARILELPSIAAPHRKRIGSSLRKKYEYWMKRGARGAVGEGSVFRQGNGAKIHKRIFTLLDATGERLPPNDFVWLIRNDPGMREVAFRHLSRVDLANSSLSKIVKILTSGFFVDDLAYVHFADFCVHAKFRRTAKLQRELESACEYLVGRGDIGVYAATIVLARFATPERILRHAESTYSVWSRHYWTGRTIAGTYPILYGAPAPVPVAFLELCRRASNSEIDSVINYHEMLIRDSSFVSTNLAYLSHSNASFPQGIYFPKSLQILSVKHNASAASAYARIRSNHPALASDPFFVARGY